MEPVNIAKYEIKYEIGVGGMATVYLAVDKLLDREVALKIMSPAIASTKGFQDGFIREARIIAKLEHPHIVKIYDVGVENNQYFMAMEYLRDGTLKQKLAKEKFTLTKSVDLIKQLASALSYAHKKGYIHRDIKPANILFRDNGDITLTDFGIAKLEGTSSDMTQMGFVTGTPHYMSPEQATGQNIDQRSDLYSLGIVFYELLTGKKPFTGANALAIAYEHMHTVLPKLEGENALLQTILSKVLAKKPEDRYLTVEDFSKDLFALYPAGDTTVISANTLNNSLPPPAKSRVGLWVFLALIVIGIGTVAAYYIVLDLKQKDIESKLKMDQIASHLEMAKAEANRERLFDQAGWSEGCKQLLIDTVGPYEANNSAEWHYREILKLDSSHQAANEALEKLKNKKYIEYSACDTYKRPKEDSSEVDSMFK